MYDSVDQQANAISHATNRGSGEPIFGLGLHLSSRPWRLGPAWAVLAGALAAQAPVWGGDSLLRLGGSIILADALWGVFWTRPTFSRRTCSEIQSRVSLPYLDANSPMGRVVSGLRWGELGTEETGWREVLTGLGLAIILSVLLGAPAILLSLLAFAASMVMRAEARRDRRLLMIEALLATGLPWVLGCALSAEGALGSNARAATVVIGLGAAMTVLTWAILKAQTSSLGSLAWPLLAAQACLLAVLVLLREPVGILVVTAFFVFPSLWAASSLRRLEGGSDPANGNDVWWLASSLAAALAVRF